MSAREQFFYDNAGYSCNPPTETEEQGHIRCAKELADDHVLRRGCGAYPKGSGVMNDRTEVRIIRLDPAGPVEKSEGGYWVPMVWVLEDGRQVDSGAQYRLLRDAKAKAATLPTSPENPMFACFKGDECRGSKTVFDLTGRT